MPSARPSSDQPVSPTVARRRASWPATLRMPRTSVREHARAAAGAWPTAAAFASYLAFALFVTWPWILDPGGRLYGVVGGDMTASVSAFQELASERQLPFLPGELGDVNAPDGVPITWALNLAAVGSSTTLWLLSVGIGSLAAHGVVAVLGYTLSAFSMFLLARWLTGSAGAAFPAGLAFGFWPYTYGTGYTWPHYIHLWVLVLVVWRMLVAAERPTPRTGLVAGAAAVFAMTWIAYNLLIAGVVYGTLATLAVARSALTRTLRPQLAAQGVAAAMVVAVVIVVFVAGRATGFAGVPARAATESVANSARPAMYVVPGPRNPLVGKRTEPWLFERFAATDPNPPPGKAIYADIYLGVSVLVFALAGALLTLTRVWRRPRSAVEDRVVWAGVVAILVGVVGAAFSAPPKATVFGVVIPMPYTLVEQVSTVFRVAHRFAVVVMLAACILAAVALAALLRRRRLALQAVLVAAVAAVFAVDLSALPSPRTTKVVHPPIYHLLERQPPGTVAEYPLNIGAAVESVERLHQDVHGHPLFMGAPAGSESESRKFELQYLLAERTVPDLAAYGVEYVLVHHQPSVPPRPGAPVRGLRYIGGDAEASLYRVVARPSRFASYGVRGFHRTEGAAPGMRWVGENAAALELRGRCRPCVGTVAFRATSFAQPRVLDVYDERGRVLDARQIGVTGTLVRFPVRFSGRTVVRLSTDPPPVAINAVIGGPDARTVSISLAQPVRFVPDPRRGHRPLP